MVRAPRNYFDGQNNVGICCELELRGDITRNNLIASSLNGCRSLSRSYRFFHSEIVL